MRSIIDEAVRSACMAVITEATDGRFDASELSGMRSFAERVRYCREHLGAPIGNGSARMVFQIDDEKCLKLAKNQKGVAQNGVESDYYKRRYDIFPKVFETDNDGLWIVCEFVLPAKKSDFKACVGVSFDDFVKWMYTTYARYDRKYMHGSWYTMDDETYGDLVENNEFFQEMEDYLCNYMAADQDMLAIRNWGLAMRDGHAWPVLLDHGLTDDVYNTYYKR